jgi:hypothetical protein
MNAAVALTMRWLHIASVVVLLGGVFYARMVVGELAPAFRRIGLGAIVGILISGLYNFLSQAHSSTYQMWFGIKILLALHIFAVVILYKQGKPRALTGVVISGAAILAIAAYLRWLSIS